MGKESVISRKRFAVLGLLVAFVLTVLPEYGMAATVSTRSLTGTKPKSQKVSEAPRARKRLTRLSRSRARTARGAHRTPSSPPSLLRAFHRQFVHGRQF